jgi:D-alanyl-D-alanine carboxypeptidase
VAGLDALAESARASGAPGVVVARRDAGETACGTAGTADIDSDIPLDASAPFNVGSVGKTLVATLVLGLVGDGQLDLNDPAEAHLGGELSIGPAVRLRDLLQHTSGVRDFYAVPEVLDAALNDPRHRWAVDDLLALVLEGPSEPPGTWSYSNTNYLLLWRVIERVGGSPAELWKRLAAPLDLRGTHLGANSAPEGLVHGYMPADNPFLPAEHGLVDATELTASRVYPPAVASTAPDVARFLEALLGGTLLSPELRRELLDAVPADGVECDAYGLGIARISSFFGTTASSCGSAWGHLGLAFGYSTIALSREDGTRQVVLLANIGMIDEEAWQPLAEAAWTAFCGD